MYAPREIPKGYDILHDRVHAAFLENLSSNRLLNRFELLDITAGIRPVPNARFLRPSDQQHFIILQHQRPDSDAVISPVHVTAFCAPFSFRTAYVPQNQFMAAPQAKFRFQCCHLMRFRFKIYFVEIITLYLAEQNKTDYIDLYQLHGGTIDDPIDETIESKPLDQSYLNYSVDELLQVRDGLQSKWVCGSPLNSTKPAG
jgi:hypothetical protein